MRSNQPSKPCEPINTAGKGKGFSLQKIKSPKNKPNRKLPAPWLQFLSEKFLSGSEEHLKAKDSQKPLHNRQTTTEEQLIKAGLPQVTSYASSAGLMKKLLLVHLSLLCLPGKENTQGWDEVHKFHSSVISAGNGTDCSEKLSNSNTQINLCCLSENISKRRNQGALLSLADGIIQLHSPVSPSALKKLWCDCWTALKQSHLALTQPLASKLNLQVSRNQFLNAPSLATAPLHLQDEFIWLFSFTGSCSTSEIKSSNLFSSTYRCYPFFQYI